MAARGRAPTGGFDLHLHSNASDGTLGPSDLARAVRDAGLEGFALTDHDTVAGLAEAGREAANLGLTLVSGIECSARHAGHGVHVLGYFLDAEHPRLLDRLAEVRRARAGRIEGILARLRGLGFELTFDDVMAEAGDGTPGRPHVAAAMLRHGLVHGEREAWRHYLGRGGAAFVPRERPAVSEAVTWIRDAGGVAVLAHPALDLPSTHWEDVLDLGMDGIEVDHPHHDPGTRLVLAKLARRRGLPPTGGSDAHGSRPPIRAIGQERVRRDVVEDLAQRAAAVPRATGPRPGPRRGSA